MRITPAFIAAILLLAMVDPLRAAESVYTKIELSKCKSLAEDPGAEEGGEGYFGKCKGYGDYPIYFKEGDLRQSLHFGMLDQKIIDEAYETFGPFNHMTNGTVEWRLDDEKKPYAAIMRFTVENMNETSGMPDKTHQGQVLAVYKVGREDDKIGCVVGYVDALANGKANDLARALTDTKASSFSCPTEYPQYIGIKGPLAGDQMVSYPGRKEK